MSQSGFDFGPLHRSSDGATRAYEAIKATVAYHGQETIATALGIDDSDLGRALKRKGRGVWLEYAIAIGSVALPEVRMRLANALVDPLGCEAVPKRQLTPEEKLAKAERLLLEKLGDVGRDIVAEINR